MKYPDIVIIKLTKLQTAQLQSLYDFARYNADRFGLIANPLDLGTIFEIGFVSHEAMIKINRIIKKDKLRREQE